MRDDEEYPEGLYELLTGGSGVQRVVLHIGGGWYIAGWEIAMKIIDEEEENPFPKNATRIKRSEIGKLLYRLS